MHCEACVTSDVSQACIPISGRGDCAAPFRGARLANPDQSWSPDHEWEFAGEDTSSIEFGEEEPPEE